MVVRLNHLDFKAPYSFKKDGFSQKTPMARPATTMNENVGVANWHFF
jgi:hypothetical protein